MHAEEGIKLVKPTQAQIKQKKTLPKTKYLEVKKAQIARNETKSKVLNRDRKNSQSKLGIHVADHKQIQSSTTQSQRILETLPQTTRNQPIGSKPAK